MHFFSNFVFLLNTPIILSISRDRCAELSTVANQICDGMTSLDAADQSQSPDDVAMATPEVPPSGQSPSNTEGVENSSSENAEVIHTDEVVGENRNGTVITAEEMDLAELKVKVVCQEKANQALRMELKCAELQVILFYFIVFISYEIVREVRTR